MTNPDVQATWHLKAIELAAAILPACLIAWFIFVSAQNMPDLEPRPIRVPLESAYAPYLDDFLVFYAAGAMASDEAENVYDPLRARHHQAQIAGQYEYAASILPFFNSPPALLPLSLLALLPLETAAVAWTAASIAVTVLAFRVILRRRLSGIDPWVGLTWVLAFVASLPFYEAVFHGQISFFLLAGSACIWLGFFQSRRPELGTLGLCVLAVKPNLLVGPVLYLLVTRQWRALLPFLAVQAAMTAVAMVLFDASLPLRHVELLIDAGGWDQVNGITTYVMFGWTGLLRGLLEFAGHDVRSVLAALLSLVSLAAIAVVWRRPEGWTAEERFMSLVAVSLLVSPHSYAQDLLVLALPFGLLASGPRDRALWTIAALACWFAMYFHFDVLRQTHVGLVSVALILLAGGPALNAWRAPRAARAPPRTVPA